MKIKHYILTILLVCTSSMGKPETQPPLPDINDIFTIGVLKYSGNKFDPAHQFDEDSFIKTYPQFIPTVVEMPVGVSFVWQNGVIVTKDKKVLFWRTCDKRFIIVDTPKGTFKYGIKEKVSLFDRI